jgi:hypothetical protein
LGGSRWWLLPLAIALLVDVTLVVRQQASPGLAVSRSIVRGASGGSCETSTLVRNAVGGSLSDDLFVIDTVTVGSGVISTAANPQFGPGGQIVPQSQQMIAEGLDIQSEPDPVPAALTRTGQPALVANYLAQLHHGDAWLSGPCVPFANPERSHLRRAGSFATADGAYTVYSGRLTTSGTEGELAKSEVWVGVRADGRVGFEVLRQLPSRNADPAVIFVAQLFTYSGGHLSALKSQPAAARIAFYDSDYQDVLSTTERAESIGPYLPGIAVPSGAAPGPSGGAAA